jgi:DNA mismatch repair protein MSH6
VDTEFLKDEQAGHCISIFEATTTSPDGSEVDSERRFGVCVLDCSTSQFNLSYFVDDVCRTRLETLMRQVCPKEIIFKKVRSQDPIIFNANPCNPATFQGTLSANTQRLLKSVLPAGCLWTALRPVEGFKYDETIEELKTIYPPGPGEDVAMDQDDPSYCILPESVPAPIREMAEDKLAIESLGTMIWYLRQLNIDKDILTMKNFNVYDPMKRGMGLTLDGQTLSHLEVRICLVLSFDLFNHFFKKRRFCSTMKEQTRDHYSNFLGGASLLLGSGSSESGFVCPCARSRILTRGTPSFFCHILCA